MMPWTAPTAGTAMCNITVLYYGQRMTAYGYKQTCGGVSDYVRFTP